MVKKRIIPVILMKNGHIVQSKRFQRHQVLGNPTTMVGRFSNWFCDELIYLDISRDAGYDLDRDDLNYPNRSGILELVDDVSKKCFMPLTVGGGIRTMEDAAQRLAHGADKVSINTQAFLAPRFISEAAGRFGSQCIVVSIDARLNGPGDWEVMIDRGRTPTGKSPRQWAIEAQGHGAGEILLNAVDRDGLGTGYDISLVRSVTTAVGIPVIALGGVGSWDHLCAGLDEGGADAVAAANIFQYTENAVYEARKALFERGYPVREPAIASIIQEDGA